jgi:two-component system, cell cycle response regulator
MYSDAKSVAITKIIGGGGTVMERILIVDNNVVTRENLRQQLISGGYDIIEAETGAQALEKAKNELPEVLIIEIMLPDMTGFQLCHQMLNMPQSDLMYVFMFTPVAGLDHKIRGFDRGANEYLTKPVDPQNLLNRVRAGMEIARKKRETVLDPLTKLYNRNFFTAYFAQEVSRAQRYDHPLTLLLGDLDHFKRINVTHGEATGDLVLAEVGKILRMTCRRSDLPVRWEEEMFAVLAHETDLMGGLMFADRIRQIVETHEFDGFKHLTISFGVATLKNNREELLKHAEKSLDEAKKSGGNKVVTAN